MKFLPILIVAEMVISNAYAGEKAGSKEVLLDNDEVQVVRLIYPPGSQSGMHKHEFPNRVVYFVKGGSLELIPDDETKEKQVIEFKDGDTVFLPGITHNVKNVGNTQVIIVETEIK